MPGTVISPIEVVHISRRGFWLAVGNSEYFLDFDLFPWFRKASVDAICMVEEAAPGHFYWPDLDVDLDLESILHPELFPLVDRATDQ